MPILKVSTPVEWKPLGCGVSLSPSVCFSDNSEQLIGYEKSHDKTNPRQLKWDGLILYLICTQSLLLYNNKVLFITWKTYKNSIEIAQQFYTWNKLKVWKIKTDMLKMFVRVLILKTCWQEPIFNCIQPCMVMFS